MAAQDERRLDAPADPRYEFAMDLIAALVNGELAAYKFVQKVDEEGPGEDRDRHALVMGCWMVAQRRNSRRARYGGAYASAPNTERRPLPHRSPRVRVPQSRPRERRPGGSRRVTRTAARQSAGDSSPPGSSEPPPPRRRAVYTFACLSPEQRGSA